MFCFFGTPCHYALSDIQVSLPVDIVTTPVVPGMETATTPRERTTFGQMMTSLLDHGHLLEEPSDMGLSCLAYALYRLCLESASSRVFSQLHRQPLHPAQKRLDQLARHVIDTPASLTTLRLSCVALAHHAYLELTDPGLLGAIKVAAGRSGEQEQQAAQADVTRRLQADPSGARCLFAHAAMLRCLLNRYTFEFVLCYPYFIFVAQQLTFVARPPKSSGRLTPPWPCGPFFGFPASRWTDSNNTSRPMMRPPS